ncbi:PREDICTED: odorant receptor 13a-like [Trachymyrmex septentrionalis]|uniref:odorant receptor 13a-like n=1 Tax=Trachymyrmex septentrionalis TaxID=34720 RepID=UPI00084F21FE|nr:PREDICTED: odorant receptor 13a-like [Trachymyrmex septentrionalis]
MWPLGSWPLDHNRNFAKLRALFLIVTQTMMIVYISVDISFHNNVTLVMAIDHLMLASCGTLTIVKIALIRLHRDNLLKNLVNASNDWTYTTKQDHRQVMFRYTNLGRFVFFFQMGSTYFVIMPLIVESLLSFATMPSQNVTLIAKSEKEMRAMQLPQEMICPFDAQIVCFSMCILQSIQLISTCTGNVGSDVFFFGVCMHLCGQLEVLSQELLQFHEKKKNGCWKRSKMVTLIERHCLLLNLAKDIVGVLNIILIAQLILHALFICLIVNQHIYGVYWHRCFLFGVCMHLCDQLEVLYLYIQSCCCSTKRCRKNEYWKQTEIANREILFAFTSSQRHC